MPFLLLTVCRIPSRSGVLRSPQQEQEPTRSLQAVQMQALLPLPLRELLQEFLPEVVPMRVAVELPLPFRALHGSH